MKSEQWNAQDSWVCLALVSSRIFRAGSVLFSGLFNKMSHNLSSLGIVSLCHCLLGMNRIDLMADSDNISWCHGNSLSIFFLSSLETSLILKMKDWWKGLIHLYSPILKWIHVKPVDVSSAWSYGGRRYFR